MYTLGIMSAVHDPSVSLYLSKIKKYYYSIPKEQTSLKIVYTNHEISRDCLALFQ